MNRDEFRKLLKDKCGFNENYDKNNNFGRKYIGLALAAEVLSGDTVGIHFYSYVELDKVAKINGPWVARKLLDVFDQGTDKSVIVTFPKRKRVSKGKNVYDEGFVAEVKVDASTHDYGIFAEQIAKFLIDSFSDIPAAKSQRDHYYSNHADFIRGYAKRQKHHSSVFLKTN